MAKETRTILVTAATGRQGGAAARHLLAGDWQVRALTRRPEAEAARALVETGAEVVKGDLEDRASLDRALKGVYGVFSVQNFWEHGAEAEVRQGKLLADAAEAAGVKHFVYSSVGGAERNPGIPHFESKWEIEKHLSVSNLPTTVLRPVFFMDNLNAPEYRSAIFRGQLSAPLPPASRLQMIAVDDIGAFVAMAFDRPKEFLGKALELAGDEPSMKELVETLGRVIGRTVEFSETPIEQVRSSSEENATMFEWFRDEGYKADIAALRALYPDLMTLETWLRKSGWAGAAQPVGARAGEESP